MEQHDAVTTTLCLQGKSDMFLTDEDLKLTKEIIDVLKPFEIATVEMRENANLLCGGWSREGVS